MARARVPAQAIYILYTILLLLLLHTTHTTVLPSSPPLLGNIQLCQALYYNQHVASTINQLYITKVSFVMATTGPRDHRAMPARPPTRAADPSSAPLRPSTWFLYHLVTSILLMATTWFGDLSAAAPPRPSTWFRDSSAATPPRPPLRVVPLLMALLLRHGPKPRYFNQIRGTKQPTYKNQS
jgi:hypothetical protein